MGSACTIIRQCVVTKLGLVPRQENTVLRSFECGTGKSTERGDKLLYYCIIGCDFLNLPNVMLSKVSILQLGEVKQVCGLEVCSKDEECEIVFGDDITDDDKAGYGLMII
ncbi:hypothetical protein RN001_013329 [Aquatica leii]|uniref:Uncharacterized protein n=1 Tax=Aquatica leii TaxID=1421715 RepID=A0AAN7NZZ3_9COLE|nr:hypothetical protein RN001_013329 [Aquatica leii]